MRQTELPIHGVKRRVMAGVVGGGDVVRCVSAESMIAVVCWRQWVDVQRGRVQNARTRDRP